MQAPSFSAGHTAAVSTPPNHADADGALRIRMALFAAFGFGTVVNALMLAMPLYSLQVFARAIPSHNLSTLAMLTLVTVLALVLASMLEVIRNRILVRIGNRVELQLGTRYRRIAALGGPQTPVADVAEVRDALNRPTAGAVLDLPWTPVYGLVIWWIHPQLFALAAGGALTLFLLGVLAHRTGARLSAKARMSGAQAQSLAAFVMDKGRGLAGCGALADALERCRQAVADATLARTASGDRGGTIAGMTRCVRQLLQLGATGLGALLVIEGHLSLGGMIATTMLIARALAPLDLVFGHWDGVVRAAGAIRRLVDASQMTVPRLRPLPPTGPGLLVVDGVGVATAPGFGTAGRTLLRGVGFMVQPGECLLVLGQNGAGKSTLARLLAGIIRPHTGSVQLDGVDTAVLDPAARAIGHVGEDAPLLPVDIAEAIGGHAPAEAEVAEALDRLGLTERIAQLPHGLDTPLEAALPTLGQSGRQRLLLARAICGRRRLLVLDEPLLGLDIAGVEAVRAMLRHAKESRVTTVVLSTQTTLIDCADRLVVLRDGCVVADGTADQLIAGQRRPPADEPGSQRRKLMP